MVVVLPTISLRPKKIKVRTGLLPTISIIPKLKFPIVKAAKFISSPKLTPFLAGTLGTLLGGIGTGIKAFIGTGLVAGALQTSPKIREVVKKRITDPTAGGRFIGEEIEKLGKPVTEAEPGLLAKITEGAKKAGLIGAGTALVAGGIIAGKKIKEKLAKAPTLPVPPVSLPSIPKQPSVTFQQLPLSVPPDIQQIPGQVQVKEKPLLPEEVSKFTMPTINNKVIVKPVINVSFRKTRKFINQQILIRR